MSAYPIPLSTPGSGTLEVTRHYPDKPGDGTGWITIDHADPRITITHELLEMIGRGECRPYARLGNVCATDCWPGWWRPCYQGARLEIAARNRRLVYVIGEPGPLSRGWSAEWPD